MPYEEHVKELTKPEGFEPAVFEGDASTPQEVCDFVLALALVYNDLHDSILGFQLHRESQPTDLMVQDQAVGSWGGLFTSLLRAQFGIVNELLALIEKSADVTRHPSFVKLVRRLPHPSREAWEALQDVADRRQNQGELGKALTRIRNGVSFHYSTKEIRRGLSLALDKDKMELLLASRGPRIGSTRFYFADAAALNALAATIKDSPDHLPEQAELLRLVNLALHQIVINFVDHRGFAWRAHGQRT